LAQVGDNNCIDFIRKKRLNVVSMNSMEDKEGEERTFDVQSDTLNPEERSIKKQQKEILQLIIDKRDTEEPGAESKVRLVFLEIFKGLSEGFNSEIIGIITIVDHLQGHEKNRIPVALHQVRISLLISLFGSLNLIEIIYCIN